MPETKEIELRGYFNFQIKQGGYTASKTVSREPIKLLENALNKLLNYHMVEYITGIMRNIL